MGWWQPWQVRQARFVDGRDRVGIWRGAFRVSRYGPFGEERRFLAIGFGAAGRHVLVVFTIRVVGEDRLIRPISARYMHRKEVAYYESNPQL